MRYNLDIPGWMREPDLKVISKLASLVPENGSILEVGSFVGRSTFALAENKPAGVDLHVVDTFEINNLYPSDLTTSVNIDGSKELLDSIQSIAKDSGSWLESFKYCLTPRIVEQLTINVSSSKNYIVPKEFDMVFIDASHSFDDVIYDIRKYSSNKTLLVGDDFGVKAPGVATAISAIRDYRSALRGTLVVPANSKIWILIPESATYWRDCFKTEISNIIW